MIYFEHVANNTQKTSQKKERGEEKTGIEKVTPQLNCSMFRAIGFFLTIWPLEPTPGTYDS